MRRAILGLTAACLAGTIAACQRPQALAAGEPLNGRQIFPTDDAWNHAIDREPVDRNSAVLIDGIGRAKPLHPDFGANYNGGPYGIPYVVVPGTQPKVPIRFVAYGNESDPGPYPVPLDAPIEGAPDPKGDRHILVIDRDNWKLYELFHTFREGEGFRADSGAIFDLKTNTKRPAGWTSADAAGLPIFPGLVRRGEVVNGEIRHALRFTVRRSRRTYVPPATHFASRSDDPNLPPMGMRVRVKAGYDISRFPASAQVVLKALKTYGMILADNGSDWFISGSPDPRWNDDEIGTLKRVTGDDLEVVKMGK